MVKITFSFKTQILRLLEIYENDPESVKGRIKFFLAFAHAMAYDKFFNGKQYSFKETMQRNALFYNWRKADEFAKQELEVAMRQQIEKDYILISKVIDSIKQEKYASAIDYGIDRKKVAGCIGVVV